MKVTKFKEELASLKPQDLKEKLDSLRREYFGLKLNATTAHIKDYSQFEKIKKNIARVATFLKQAERSKTA